MLDSLSATRQKETILGRNWVAGAPAPGPEREAIARTGMFPRILKRLRELVRTKHYVMTLHAEEEMDEDGLRIFDVENCLLSGEIVDRQKDQATVEWKYLVRGTTLDETKQIVVVAKLGPTGKLVIITVYEE